MWLQHQGLADRPQTYPGHLTNRGSDTRALLGEIGYGTEKLTLLSLAGQPGVGPQWD